MTRGRPWHLLAVGLIAFVLLGVGTVLDGWLPGGTDDPGAEPHVREAAVGEAVELRTLTVEVESVRGAKVLDSAGSVLRSPGVWVLVGYTVTASVENTSVGLVELRDGSDRLWTLGGRNDTTCPTGPPGVPVGCSAHFEVPPDALRSLRLRLAPDFLEQRYEAVAEVDLDLTDEDAARFAEAPALEVPDPTLGGRP